MVKRKSRPRTFVMATKVVVVRSDRYRFDSCRGYHHRAAATNPTSSEKEGHSALDGPPAIQKSPHAKLLRHRRDAHSYWTRG